MTIIKTFTESDFIREFEQSSRANQFSYEALVELYAYLNEFDFEMDVIAICCDFTEYETIDDLLNDYSDATLSDIQDNTWCVELDNGAVLIANF